MSSRDHPDWWRPMGGQNSQDSTLERRSLLWNDNGIEDGTIPPHIHVALDDAGKFFSRGMRGKIEEIQVYCTGDGVGTVDLILSSGCSLGPFQTITLTPAAGWAWQAVAHNMAWNYDSLFIWLADIDPAISWGGDLVEPLDGHYSLDDGVTWLVADHRPFIRLVYAAQTPGDVPVSGIINNIPIPSVSTKFANEHLEIEVGVLTPIVDIYGAGYCDFIRATVTAVAGSENTRIYVICDEVTSMNEAYNLLNAWGILPNTPTIGLPRYAIDEICVMLIHKRFEFRRHLRISAFNAAAAPDVAIYAYPTLLR